SDAISRLGTRGVLELPHLKEADAPWGLGISVGELPAVARRMNVSRCDDEAFGVAHRDDDGLAVGCDAVRLVVDEQIPVVHAQRAVAVVLVDAAPCRPDLEGAVVYR